MAPSELPAAPGCIASPGLTRGSGAQPWSRRPMTVCQTRFAESLNRNAETRTTNDFVRYCSEGPHRIWPM
eukprot:10033640-Alexandrium_andersonii.AAC.1